MSILNVNKINPVGSGSTITIVGIASVTNNISVGNSVTASSFHGNLNNSTLLLQTGGNERFRITGDGHTLPGVDNTSDLGSSSKRWANIYSADLQLSNIGTGGNEVDGTEGKWTLQEAEDTVYMINRITGKRYKIKMEEV